MNVVAAFEEGLGHAAAVQQRSAGQVSQGVFAPKAPSNAFAEALAKINERRLHQRLLRRPQGRTVFV